MQKNIHHVAIICSNYEASKLFYIDILGLQVTKETYRQEKVSCKLDLPLNGHYIIELFPFPDPPNRLSKPTEATGFRHLALEVDSSESMISHLENHTIQVEPIRIDEITNKRFAFVPAPDKLPIELCEI